MIILYVPLFYYLVSNLKTTTSNKKVSIHGFKTVFKLPLIKLQNKTKIYATYLYQLNELNQI
jgi:hypothetical protein